MNETCLILHHCQAVVLRRVVAEALAATREQLRGVQAATWHHTQLLDEEQALREIQEKLDQGESATVVETPPSYYSLGDG